MFALGICFRLLTKTYINALDVITKPSMTSANACNLSEALKEYKIAPIVETKPSKNMTRVFVNVRLFIH